MCSFNLDAKAYLEQTEPLCTLKTVIAGSIPVKLTEFSWGNNVLHAPASSIAGFLWRDTCVSLT
jgi:hypothetical protein